MIYFYQCDKCGRDYIEQRDANDPQWFTICECGGTFIEKTSEISSS